MLGKLHKLDSICEGASSGAERATDVANAAASSLDTPRETVFSSLDDRIAVCVAFGMGMQSASTAATSKILQGMIPNLIRVSEDEPVHAARPQGSQNS